MLRVDRCREWMNWLTFEPDPDYSPDAETGLFYPISYALQRGILLRPENPTYRYVIFIYFILLFSHYGYYFNKRLLPCLGARRCSEALFLNGLIHRESWEHLCRKYMRSTALSVGGWLSGNALASINVVALR